MMNEPSVAYVCDRNACLPSVRENGCGECTHTQNIEHAINFTEIFPGMYVELVDNGQMPEQALLRALCLWLDSNPGKTILVEQYPTAEGKKHRATIKIFRPIEDLKKEIKEET